jgi:hypothetical protein
MTHDNGQYGRTGRHMITRERGVGSRFGALCTRSTLSHLLDAAFPP